MEIRVLVENVVYNQGLYGEHGLSFLVKEGGVKILFDTGQTDNIIKNMAALKETIEDIDYIVLSHGHYDHTGGLKYILEKNKTAKVLLKRAALDEKVSTSTGKERDISFPMRNMYNEYPNEFVFVEDIYDISENIKIIANIDKKYEFEDDEKKLFVRKEKLEKDEFNDELFMTIINKERLNVFTGCAHSGIINILHTAIDINKMDKIGSIIGGTHLKGKSDERIIQTLKELDKIDFMNMYVCHCTGIEEYVYLKSKFGNKVDYAYTGKTIKY